MTRTEFLNRALDAAQAARNAGAPINPTIAAAQAALESAFGRSQLAQHNNLKGVKAGSRWTGRTVDLPTREFINGQWISTVATWRVYDSWEHAFSDYGELIRRVYPQAAAVANDARAFLEALVAGPLKYATDPNYVQKVWAIVRQFELPAHVPPPPASRTVYQTLVVHNTAGREWIFRHPFVMTIRGGRVDIRFTEGEVHA